jgi:hypothetical protein
MISISAVNLMKGLFDFHQRCAFVDQDVIFTITVVIEMKTREAVKNGIISAKGDRFVMRGSTQITGSFFLMEWDRIVGNCKQNCDLLRWKLELPPFLSTTKHPDAEHTRL